MLQSLGVYDGTPGTVEGCSTTGAYAFDVQIKLDAPVVLFDGSIICAGAPRGMVLRGALGAARRDGLPCRLGGLHGEDVSEHRSPQQAQDLGKNWIGARPCLSSQKVGFGSHFKSGIPLLEKVGFGSHFL